MGADSRWVCHTCKTVCSPGFGDMWSHPKEVPTPKDILLAIQSSQVLFGDFISPEWLDTGRASRFLETLYDWLGRHEGHNVHIGSDYSTDMMDLEDYYDETLEGKISDITRIDAQMQGINAFEEKCITEIQEIVDKKGLHSKGKAEQLYKLFSTRLW